MRRFEGKSVLVTGGSSGIGKATVERFAREGANVLIFADRVDDLRNTTHELQGQGYAVIECHGDVSHAGDVRRAVELAVKSFGRIDVLVANAGIARNEEFLAMSEESWDRTMDVNLKGMFLIAQACARQMVRQIEGGQAAVARDPDGKTNGVLLFTASVNGIEAETGLTSYNASKAGVILMMKTIALELARYRIRANAVCPGLIHTPLTSRFVNSGANWDHYARGIVWKRAGKASEVASTFAFLASEDAEYITGECINIDGGQMAALSEPRIFDEWVDTERA